MLLSRLRTKRLISQLTSKDQLPQTMHKVSRFNQVWRRFHLRRLIPKILQSIHRSKKLKQRHNIPQINSRLVIVQSGRITRKITKKSMRLPNRITINKTTNSPPLLVDNSVITLELKIPNPTTKVAKNSRNNKSSRMLNRRWP